jgi:hypothetical protein
MDKPERGLSYVDMQSPLILFNLEKGYQVRNFYSLIYERAVQVRVGLVGVLYSGYRYKDKVWNV